MNKRKDNLSQEMTGKKEHENVNFYGVNKKKSRQEKKLEQERFRLEKLIENKIEETEKKLNNNDSSVTKIMPTISLDESNKENKKNESLIKKIIEKSKEKKKIKVQKKLEKQKQNEEKKRLDLEKKESIKRKIEEDKKNKEELIIKKREEKKKIKEELKQRKIEALKQKKQQKENANHKKEEERLKKLQEKENLKNIKISKQKEKEEQRIKKNEERKKIKEELKLKKLEEFERKQEEKNKQKIEREEQKKQEKEEKERIKAEKELLDSTGFGFENGSIVNKNTLNKKQEKEERKRLLKEKKQELKAKKEEERKQKYKEKYEEIARKKKLKEEKDIKEIKEKREKENRIKKEKEQSRIERKEKAQLIKKAQEESKRRAKSEKKNISEKIKDWYNNLSIVRDRKNRKEMQRQTLLLDFEGEDAVRSEEKIVYKYVAKSNETGKVETGMFAAFSKLDVHSFLLAEGYEVYEITPQKNISRSFSFVSHKFKASELDFFLTQLSTFLKAGITLVESVKILSKQSNMSAHKNVYKSIIYELTMGENFSEALSKQGTVFPRLLINMIKTSELTGDLPETLDDMANYYKETEQTKKQMISAITYPAVVLCFAFVILIFIMVSVIPQFVSIYANMETGLPAITVAVISISNFLKSYWVFVVMGIIGFIVVFMILFKSIKVFKSVVQSLIMNVPIIGKIIIYNEVTMFTKTFASLLNHNVYITDCMEVLSKITNNEVYKMLIFDTITNLAKGEAISNSFKNHWAFPSIAYEMILTGERTGQLGEMMDKVATYYQELHKNAVGQIKAFIEPIMIIALAAIVGVVLLSVILPMFDMYQNIGV